MKRLILVEDEIDFQVHIADALSSNTEQWSINNFINGKSAIGFSKRVTGQPSIAVVDLGLPDMSGLEVIKEFHHQWPDMPILIFTAHPSMLNVREGLSSGACGYIVKHDEAITIATAVNEVLNGHIPLSPKITGYVTSLLKIGKSNKKCKPSLSRQEQRLLDLISAGYSYAVAAHSMGLKLSTVHSYSRTLFKKLNVNSKTQALLRAREFGFTK